MPREETFTYDTFTGIDEFLVPPGVGRFTRRLDNMRVRHQRMFGRGGTSKFRNNAVDAGAAIVGLFEFERADLTSDILRMLPTAIEHLDTGSNLWVDITGTALTGFASTKPQSTSIDDKIVMTNEGADKPRVWDGVAATTREVTDSANIPFCKTLAGWLGFLFVGNVSDDGTFTDVENGHLIVRFADDWDGIDGWNQCEGQELVLDETPGAVLAFCIVGRTLIAFKSDALIAITFIGGAVQFKQQRIPFDKGLLAPLSVVNVGDFGCVFYATDRELYVTNGIEVRPVQRNLNNTLQKVIFADDVTRLRAVAFPDKETYHLFYPSARLGRLDARVSWNHRTGEFFKASYAGQEFESVLAARLSDTEPNILLGAGVDFSPGRFVWQLDDLNATDDDGTSVNREAETDWQHLGLPNGDKYLTGVTVHAARIAGARVEISVATDWAREFKFKKTFSLAGRGSGGSSSDDDDIHIHYDLPHPIKGVWYNVKVRAFHDKVGAEADFRAISFQWVPTSTTHKQEHVNEGTVTEAA